MGADTVAVCPAHELPPGARRVVEADELQILVVNCGGQLLAIENRCSHEDTPLDDGELEPGCRWIACPRHGSRFDLRTGRPLSLPAYAPVDVFAAEAKDGMISVRLD